jgi:transposase
MDAGMSTSDAARTFGVGQSSIKRYRAQRRTTGDLAPRKSPGRSPNLRPEQRPLLLAQVREHPDATLAEHCAWWEAATGQHFSISTMARTLGRVGCPRQPRPRGTAVMQPSKPHTEPSPPPPHPDRSLPMSATRRPYPTDLTDAEWAVLQPLVPPPKTGGRPCVHDRREIIDAIGYVLRSGCAWQLLPHDFPPAKTVYHYFRLWRIDGTWERIHDTLREQVRVRAGRDAQPSAGIVDSQSIRTTEKGGSAATTGARRSTDASGTSWSM